MTGRPIIVVIVFIDSAEPIYSVNIQYCVKIMLHRESKCPMPEMIFCHLTIINSNLKAPFRIYADFECFLPKIEGCSPDPNTSSSTATHKHVPSGFCYLVVSDVEKYCKPSVVYRGPDVMKHFIKCVMKENEEIQKILSTPA